MTGKNPNTTNNNQNSEYVIAQVDLGAGPEWSLIRIDGVKKDGKNKGPDGFTKHYGNNGEDVNITITPVPDPNLWNNPGVTNDKVRDGLEDYRIKVDGQLGNSRNEVMQLVPGEKNTYAYKPEFINTTMNTIGSLQNMVANGTPVIDGVMVINQRPENGKNNVSKAQFNQTSTGYTIRVDDCGQQNVAPITIGFRKNPPAYQDLYSASSLGNKRNDMVNNVMEPTSAGWFNTADSDLRYTNNPKKGTDAKGWQPTSVNELGKLTDLELKAVNSGQDVKYENPEEKFYKEVIPNKMLGAGIDSPYGHQRGYGYSFANDAMNDIDSRQDKKSGTVSTLNGLANSTGTLDFDYDKLVENQKYINNQAQQLQSRRSNLEHGKNGTQNTNTNNNSNVVVKNNNKSRE